MYIKRGLIYLVVFLFLVVSVNPALVSVERRGGSGGGSSAPLSCSDGTLFGECNPEALLCAGVNLIVDRESRTLNTNTQYIFFAEPIEPCPNPVLQLGSRRITLTNTGRRIVAQFTSQGESFDIKVFCDSIERDIEKKYLGVVYTHANYDVRLHRDPLICETETELMELCVSTCNIDFCDDIKNTASKNIALEQYAVNCNEPSVCPPGLCAQKVIVFNCFSGNCDESLASVSIEGYEINPGFKSGGDVYVRYDVSASGSKKIKKFKLGSGRERPENICEIHIKKDYSTGSIEHDYLHYNLGTTILSSNSNIFNLAQGIRTNVNRLTSAYLPPSSVSTCSTCDVITTNFPWSIERDCGSSNCNLLEGEIITPRADLLCGQDTKWYLCDQDGIKTFGNGARYLCNGDSGTWTKLN